MSAARTLRLSGSGCQPSITRLSATLLLSVHLLGPAQNIGVRVALDAAVQELVARGEPIEQAGPAPAGAENHGVAPDHGQFAPPVDERRPSAQARWSRRRSSRRGRQRRGPAAAPQSRDRNRAALTYGAQGQMDGLQRPATRRAAVSGGIRQRYPSFRRRNLPAPGNRCPRRKTSSARPTGWRRSARRAD